MKILAVLLLFISQAALADRYGLQQWPDDGPGGDSRGGWLFIGGVALAVYCGAMWYGTKGVIAAVVLALSALVFIGEGNGKKPPSTTIRK